MRVKQQWLSRGPQAEGPFLLCKGGQARVCHACIRLSNLTRQDSSVMQNPSIPRELFMKTQPTPAIRKLVSHTRPHSKDMRRLIGMLTMARTIAARRYLTVPMIESLSQNPGKPYSPAPETEILPSLWTVILMSIPLFAAEAKV